MAYILTFTRPGGKPERVGAYPTSATAATKASLVLVHPPFTVPVPDAQRFGARLRAAFHAAGENNGAELEFTPTGCIFRIDIDEEN